MKKGERLAILKRDEHQSQMQHYNEEQGWHNNGYCGDVDINPCTHLQVHHIQPRRTGGLDEPTNLITLYQCEHVGVCPDKRIEGGLRGGKYAPDNMFVVHRDIRDATMEYKGDVNMYNQVFEARNEQLKQGNIYWNTTHDVEMKQTAVERSQNPGWWLGWANYDQEAEQEPVETETPKKNIFSGLSLDQLNDALFG